MDAIRVVLADDHPIVGAGMHILEEARHLFQDLAPDILLLEMSLADEHDPTSVRQVNFVAAATRVFVLRGYHGRAYVFGLLTNGSAGELTEHEALEAIVEAIEAGRSGEGGGRGHRVVAKLPTRQLEGTLAAMPDLTPRERDVLEQLTIGRSDQAISQQLGISKRTVRYHLQNIYAKLGVNQRSEAIVWAVRAALGQ